MDKKLRVGILFGGKSTEHEVSLQSAKNVIANLDREKFEPVLIAIDKEGRWLLPDATAILGDGSINEISSEGPRNETALLPESHGVLMCASQTGNMMQPLDVVFPVLHGGFGEDGTVQGLLKLAGIPFVGAGVLGSAVGMDKDVMKRLLREAGIPVVRFLVARQSAAPAYATVVESLGAVSFVKPANAGSAVGVHRVSNEEEYREALNEAFMYDTKVLVEEAVEGREIECAILGNEYPEASVPGEIVLLKGFYSYEAKYLDRAVAAIEIPAQVTEEVVKKVQELAIKTFQTLACEGLARVDLFLKDDGTILVNGTIAVGAGDGRYPRGEPPSHKRPEMVGEHRPDRLASKPVCSFFAVRRLFGAFVRS